MRDTTAFFSGTLVCESFINPFPQDTLKKEIELYAICKGESVRYRFHGEQKKIMMDPEDVMKKLYPSKRSRVISDIDTDLVEVEAFSGELIYKISGYKKSLDVEIDAYASTSGREIKKNNFLILFISHQQIMFEDSYLIVFYEMMVIKKYA